MVYTCILRKELQLVVADSLVHVEFLLFQLPFRGHLSVVRLTLQGFKGGQHPISELEEFVGGRVSREACWAPIIFLHCITHVPAPEGGI